MKARSSTRITLRLRHGAAGATRRCVVAVALLGFAGCGPSVVPSGRPPPHPIAHRPRPAPPPKIPSLSAHEIVRVPADTFGPYLATSGERRLAVWVVPAAEGKRTLHDVPLDAAGVPTGDTKQVGELGGNLELAALRGTGDGIKGAAFVFLTANAGGAVNAWLLDAKGDAIAGPVRAGHANEKVYWVNAIPSSQGTIVFWAARRGDRADVFSALLSPSGEAGAPVEVSRDAKAWQVAPFGDGAAVGIVRATLKEGESGPVDLVYTDAEGRPRGKPISVLAKTSASLDLDLVAAGDHVVLAWSDVRNIEGRVFLAAVGADGSLVRPPGPATEPFGEQALVRLVPPLPPSKTAFLVWEQTLERPPSGRLLRIGAVSADGTLGDARATMVAGADPEQPLELRASPHGVAILTSAPMCRHGEDCGGEPWAATFAELDEQMKPLASEPFRLSGLDGQATTMAWDLSCAANGCLALSAAGGTPTPTYTVALGARSSAWQPAADTAETPPPPRVTRVEAVADADPLSDITATPVTGGALVSWLTYFDPTTPATRLKSPAVDGRFDPLRAFLGVGAVTDEFGHVPTAQTVSLRARSLGGAVLATDAKVGNSLLAWAALDKGSPQVFLSLIGRDGRKIHQRMLTRVRGEKSDVTTAFAANGWLVAWVDARNKSQELYLTKVNRALTTIVPEHSITDGPSSVTGPTLLVRGSDAWLAWADARDASKPGWASIFLVKVGAGDGVPKGKPSRVSASELHAFSPVLAPFGDATAIAWIESDPNAPPQTPSGDVRIGRLDAAGHFIEPPVFVQVDGRAFTSLALSCSPERCHVVGSAGTAERRELMAFDFTPGHATQPSPLIALAGPALTPAFPTFAGEDLFYADQTADGRGRVRRMRIQWP